MTWTLIIMIWMTRGSSAEIRIPGFETPQACAMAGERYTAIGMSSVMISRSHRCMQDQQ